jgi:predicted enzyme related to lactoylglutathione lyase
MNALNWFEIPATDIDRAQRFYEALLGTRLQREAMVGQQLAIFPYEQGPGVGGALVAGPAYTPSAGGAVVYLPASPTLDATLARLPAGGRVVTPKVTLPDGKGAFAHIEDCEGNRVGLHAPA